MALAHGTRLGPYEVTAPLGEGGMGAVYRARDTKLDRDVALKILPEVFVHDADRVARFTREAKTLAALNHPHIAGIHGLEESGGVTALVMKPANIKVRADGTVKVLDFGLAKALTPEGSGATAGAMSSPTIRTPDANGLPVVLAGGERLVVDCRRSVRRVVMVDRTGAERELPVPQHPWVAVRVSPDGLRLALNRWEGARRTLWTLALDTGALTQVTYVEDMFRPAWPAKSALGASGVAANWRVSRRLSGKMRAAPGGPP